MRSALPSLIAAVFIVIPANSTLVVFQWSPNEMLLAADSLNTKVGPNGPYGVLACKIHQAGDIFFTIVGVNDDPANKVDLVALANHSATTKGGIFEKFTAFERLAQKQIEVEMRKNVTAALGFKERQRITVIFVDRKAHAAIVKEWVRNPDGSTSDLPRDVYSAPRMKADPLAVGVYAEAEAAFQKDPRMTALEGIPNITRFVQSQIDYEAYRLRVLHSIPRVGGEICILKITGGMAFWVDGHQGQCPKIQR